MCIVFSREIHVYRCNVLPKFAEFLVDILLNCGVLRIGFDHQAAREVPGY